MTAVTAQYVFLPTCQPAWNILGTEANFANSDLTWDNFILRQSNQLPVQELIFDGSNGFLDLTVPTTVGTTKERR